jgi:glycosyltransferase involved in cell wall biosynthesis
MKIAPLKEVFIISTMQIFKGKSAGSQRILNIAKSLALGNISVYLCSLINISKGPLNLLEIHPKVYYLESKNLNKNNILNQFRFLSTMNKFMKERNSEVVIYLYPTSLIFYDFIYLLYFKIIKKYKFYTDINELRITNLYTLSSPKNIFLKIIFYLKFLKDIFIYKLNEIQVLFYDGIIVISKNLEKYFSKYSKKIIRIPILCDLSRINFEDRVIPYQKGTFKICFSGTISVKKEGFDILFEALSIVNHKKDVELYLYGFTPDNDRTKIISLTEKFNIKDKVFYKGFILPEMLQMEFVKYDLLIIPRPLNKQTKYGFSTKLSEYLVSGVPVLLTDVSDNTLFIKNGYNGFITSPGSISQMVSQINYIIDNYGKYFDLITRNAYNTARENFDYKLFTSSLIDFFYSEKS